MTAFKKDSFQSTPSARRATGGESDGQAYQPISIHALREEGDLAGKRHNNQQNFISIHALREEGDSPAVCHLRRKQIFQSTPSARRATLRQAIAVQHIFISIHALREEGDNAIHTLNYQTADFNPRPPRGGRLNDGDTLFWLHKFQSTPSARRATAKAAKKSTTFVPLYTLVHNLKRNFTKAPAK